MDADLTRDQEAALEALRTAGVLQVSKMEPKVLQGRTRELLDDLVRFGYAYVDRSGFYRYLPPTEPRPPRGIKEGDRVVVETLTEGLIIVREIITIQAIRTSAVSPSTYLVDDTDGGKHTWRARSTHAVVVN